MIFKKYVKNLVELLKEHPEYGEFETIYAKDDEGNGFQIVNFSPTIGNYNPENYEGDFHSEESLLNEPEEYEDIEDYPLNAVCIN